MTGSALSDFLLSLAVVIGLGGILLLCLLIPGVLKWQPDSSITSTSSAHTATGWRSSGGWPSLFVVVAAAVAIGVAIGNLLTLLIVLVWLDYSLSLIG